MIPQKISFRLGELAGPMAAKIAATEETPSEYIRRVVAADLGCDVPEMRGNVAYLKQFAKKKRSRKKRKA
jgi:hypothetical protein